MVGCRASGGCYSHGMRNERIRKPRRGFTLIELLVVVSVIALLIGILLPALGAARRQAIAVSCASNLKQLGLGIGMYYNDYPSTLPQVRVNSAGDMVRPGDADRGENIGALFGGKKGLLPFIGIDRIGAERRPLNEYVYDGELPPDESTEADEFELEVFRSPADQGTSDPFVKGLGVPTTSMYELLGSSYTLNDHALDDTPFAELYPTLIPREGGRIPRVRHPTKVWVLGSHPIYNFDDGAERGQRWYRPGAVEAGLLFFDGHVEASVPVEEGVTQETADYTFLPSPDWLEQFEEPLGP